MVKIKFDKDGWFVGQVVKTKVNHDEDHDRLYCDVKPNKSNNNIKCDKSKFVVHGHTTHKDMIEEDQKIVPLYQTKYKGKKFEEWNKKCSGAFAVVSKSSKSDKMVIVKILIPKQTNKKR